MAHNVNLDDFPVAYYITFAIMKCADVKEVDVEKWAKCYNLRALIDIARFEHTCLRINADQPIEESAPTETIKAMGILTSASYAAYRASQEIKKEKGFRYDAARQIIIDSYGSIRAREGIDEYNARVSAQAKKEWMPFIQDVHNRLGSGRAKKISDACRHAIKGTNKSWKTLSNVYGDWKKNPAKYESR